MLTTDRDNPITKSAPIGGGGPGWNAIAMESPHAKSAPKKTDAQTMWIFCRFPSSIASVNLRPS